MGANEDFYYRQFFQLKVYRVSGDDFQRLFNQVMGYTHPGFQAITPWGNWGDGGNDGWIPDEGHYFQVYGPRPTTSADDSETTALKKAIDDFDKLPKKWQDVRHYSFVMNDRFQGIPAPIGSALQKLEKDKRLTSARGFSMANLMELFMQLALDKRQDIIGGIPPADITFIDPREVAALLKSLADNADTHLTFLTDKAPDFDEKIEFNGLTDPVSAKLRALSYQVSLIDDFLDSRDSGLRQAIAQEIRDYYQQSKLDIPEGLEDAGNRRYFWLVDRLIPSTVTHPHSVGAYRAAAELVIAKYFETCDAYDHPNGTVTA
jgi:hypothetical protein